MANPIYFLTNSMNLRSILSSGIIGPRDSFYKYYDDLLIFSPRFVPFFLSVPSISAIDKVVAERGAEGPVILEISTHLIKPLKTDGKLVFVEAVSLEDVRSIHFPDSNSSRRFLARRYENVFVPETLVRVSPDLFSSEEPEVLSINPPESGNVINWNEVDRLRGSFNGFRLVAGLEDALSSTSMLLRFLEVSGQDISLGSLAWEIFGLCRARNTGYSLSRAIFESSYRVIGVQDRISKWRPLEIIQVIKADLEGSLDDKETKAMAFVNLEAISRILSGDEEFEPFILSNKSDVVAKGLLLVLLRPSLRKLTCWMVDQIEIGEQIATIACVLSGRLRGHAREEIEIRDQRFDRVTARIFVEWATQRESHHEDPRPA